MKFDCDIGRVGKVATLEEAMAMVVVMILPCREGNESVLIDTLLSIPWILSDNAIVPSMKGTRAHD